MPELTERQRFLLALIVHEYVRTAAPVGSRYLVEHYHLDMSSATVRNELAALTERGYLRQPHTSAGRIPTEEGYRYFVGRLLQETNLPEPLRATITHQFYQMRHDVAQWMRLAASVLAHQSRSASLVTAPHPELARIKHLELISTRGRQVLMVIVMVGGEVRQRLVTLTEPVSQEQLSSAAAHLTDALRNLDINDIMARQAQFTGLVSDMLGYLIEELSNVDALVSGELYLDGLSNVLSEPEFSGAEDARRALRVLEERPLLQDVLSHTVLAPAGLQAGGVQVLIGGEGAWEDLRQCTLILTRYGAPGLVGGTLGVLGPMRMPYGRAISTMRFLSGLLSEMVSETLGEE